MDTFRKLCLAGELSGYFTGLGASLANVLGAACVQRLGDTVPPFQLNAARYFAQVVTSFFIAVCTRKTLRIAPIKFPWAMLIAILSVLDNTFYFTSAQYLPLGNLTIIYVTLLYTGTILISKLFLDRDIHLAQFILFLVILVGQFLLLQPYSHMNTEGEAMGSYISKHNQDGMVNNIHGYILVTLSSLMSILKAFVYRIYVNEVPTGVLALWVGLIGLVTSLLIMIYTEEPVLVKSRLPLLFVAGHAALASTGSILITYTQQVLNPLVYGILLNMQEVFGFILQYSLPQFLLSGHRNVLEVVGAVIVMSGIFTYIVIDLRIRKVMSLDNM